MNNIIRTILYSTVAVLGAATVWLVYNTTTVEKPDSSYIVEANSSSTDSPTQNYSSNDHSYKNQTEAEFRTLPVAPFPKAKTKVDTLVLGSKNSLVFRGVVTKESASNLIYEARRLSLGLRKTDKIYLVLDTPGGSVDAGEHLIDSLKALPQKVETVTLFAASMGFHIVQNMGTRYITPSGTLMSHRAFIEGLAGEIPGEAVVRMQYLMRMMQKMDITVSERIGLPLQNYQRLIADEFWIDGADALRLNMADKVTQLQCTESLTEQTYSQVVRTFFGNVELTWSKCPVIDYPLNIDFGNLTDVFANNSQEDINKIKKYIATLVSNKREFVENYVVNGKYDIILKND